MANESVILSVGGNFSRLEAQLRRIQKNNNLNFTINERATLQPLGRIRAGIDQVEASLRAANQRVVTFGASAVVLGGTIQTFSKIFESVKKTEKAFADINSVLNLNSADLKRFSRDLFDTARNSATAFDVAATAAVEFSRQGLGVEETLKRVNSALVLTRLSGLESGKAVESLTAAINGFSKENLTAEKILNKLVAVDTRFAVSTADLAEALSRVGSTAQDAGVSFDKLLALITSAQQITARGGSVIGNSFKTIFSRIQRPEVINQLESFGIVVKDFSGNVLSADRILANLGKNFDSLSKSEQQFVAELSAGIYQINQFRAVMSDLGRTYNFVSQAADIASSASVEAIKRNEALNRSFGAVLQNFNTTATQIGSTIGELTFAPLFKSVLSSLEGTSIIDALKGANLDSDSRTIGQDIANSILSGIGQVLKGPGLLATSAVLFAISKKAFSVIKDDAIGLLRESEGGGGPRAAARGLETVLSQATSKDRERLSLVSSIQEKERIILEILAKQNQLKSVQAGENLALISSIAKKSPVSFNTLKNIGQNQGFASGYLPVREETSAIKRGVGGASPSAKPVVIPNFNFGGGKKGSVVANTDEYLVPNYAFGGTAVFNKDMVRAMGLPPGALKVNAAGGFVPNYANKYLKNKGIARYIDEGAYGQAFSLKNKFVTKEFFDGQDSSSEAMIGEYLFTKALAGSSIPGLRFVSPIGSLQRSMKRGYIGKPFVENAGALRSYKNSSPIVSQLSAIVKKSAKKIIDREFPSNDFFQGGVSSDVHSGNFGFNKEAAKIIGNVLFNKKSPERQEQIALTLAGISGDKSKTERFLSRLAKKGGEFQIYDPVSVDLSSTEIFDVFPKIASRVGSSPFRNKFFSGGFVPNFASPLTDAVERELKSGVNVDDVYIDRDPRVKSPKNPMGLLVANRRDEPSDGSQGVNRAIKEGFNPKTYGAANGFIPNFAEFSGARFFAGERESDFNQFFLKKEDQTKLRSLFRSLRQEGASSVEAFDKISKEISSFAESAKLTKDTLDEVRGKISAVGEKLKVNIQKQEKEARFQATRSGGRLDEQFGGVLFSGQKVTDDQFKKSTFVENYLKKQLNRLSNPQIEGLLKTQNLSFTNRREDITQLRAVLSGKAITGGQVNEDRISALLGLSASGTLFTNFEETVKKLVVNGNSLSTAYSKASKEFINLGGNSKQLGKAQLQYADSLNAFSASIQDQKLALANTVTYNRAVENVGEGKPLSLQQTKVLVSAIKKDVTKTLFAGIDEGVIAKDKNAQNLIAKKVRERFSEIINISTQTALAKLNQQNEAAAAPLIEKLNGGRFGGIFSNVEKRAEKLIKQEGISGGTADVVRNAARGLEQQRLGKAQSAAIAASFIAPLVGGFVPRGRGGETSGQIGGFVEGAVGVGSTALLASQFIPGLNLAVVGITAALGGIYVAMKRGTKSFEEFADSVSRINSSFSQQIDSANNFVQIQQKINDAIQNGADENAVRDLISAQLRALKGIKDKDIRESLLSAGSDVEKQLKAITPLSNQAGRAAAGGDVIGALASARGDGFFSKFTQRGNEDAINALISATDLSDPKVKSAFEKFRGQIKEDPVEAFGFFAEAIDLPLEEVKQIKKVLDKSPKDFAFIFESFVNELIKLGNQTERAKENVKALTARESFSSQIQGIISQIDRSTRLGQVGFEGQTKRAALFSEARASLTPGLSESQRADIRFGSLARQTQQGGAQTRGNIIAETRRSVLDFVRDPSKTGLTEDLIKGLRDLRSEDDLRALISVVGKSNKDLVKILESSLLSLEANNQITEESLKEIRLQSGLEKIRIAQEQKNRVLSSSLFSEDFAKSFSSAVVLSNRNFQNRGLAANSKLDLLDSADRLGLVESGDTSLIRDVLRETSSKETFSSILSSITGDVVSNTDAAIRAAVNEISSGDAFNIIQKDIAERIKLSLDAIQVRPEDQLAQLASGDISALDLTGIDFGTQAIVTSLSPLTSIDTGIADLNKLFNDFLNNEQVKATSKEVSGLREQQTTIERDLEVAYKKLAEDSFKIIESGLVFASRGKRIGVTDLLANAGLRRNISPEFRAIYGDRASGPSSSAFAAAFYFDEQTEKGKSIADTLSELRGKGSQPIAGANLSFGQIKKLTEELAGGRTSEIISNLQRSRTESVFSPLEAKKYEIAQQIQSKTSNVPETSGTEESSELLADSAEATREIAENSEKTLDFSTREAEIRRVIDGYLSGINNLSKTRLELIKNDIKLSEASLARAKELKESNLVLLEIKRELVNKELELARASEDSLSTFTLGFKDRFLQLKEGLSDFSSVAGNIFDSFESNASDAFGDFVTRTKTGKEAFRDFAQSVLNDSARAFARKAVQGSISLIGDFGASKLASGGPVKMATGGTVPALLMGGEYYLSPEAVRNVGKDNLDRLNNGAIKKYAYGGGVSSRNGGFYVSGGSGYKDDVPANLRPGGYVLRKSAVNRYGRDYVENLANGRVQKKFFGGLITPILIGGLLGAGVGYLTGGKKGALIGAGLGMAGGYMMGSMGSGGIGAAANPAAMQPAPSYTSFAGAFSNSTIGNVGTIANPVGMSVNLPSAGVAAGAAAGGGGLGGIAANTAISAALGIGSSLFNRDNSIGSAMAPEIKSRATKEGEYAFFSDGELMGYGKDVSVNRYSNGGPIEPFSFGYSQGGSVGGTTVPMISSEKDMTPSVYVKIDINNNGEVSSNSNSDKQEGKFGKEFSSKLEKQVRDIVKDELVQSKRVGGVDSQIKRNTS